MDTTKLEFRYAGFDNAAQKAAKENKLILVYVTSDNGGACAKFERDVLTDTNVQNCFNDKFVGAKIRFEWTASVMKDHDFENLNGTKVDFLDFYGVQSGYPAFLILTTREIYSIK